MKELNKEAKNLFYSKVCKVLRNLQIQRVDKVGAAVIENKFSMILSGRIKSRFFAQGLKALETALFLKRAKPVLRIKACGAFSMIKV